MYQQPKTINYSSESLRRLSSNNPFRQYELPTHTNHSTNSVSSKGKGSNFDEWIQKNKELLDLSDDDEPLQPINMNVSLNHSGNSSNSGRSFSGYASPLGETFSRPEFPTRPTRTGSDSSVNYGSKMSSNNPFAAAMQEPTFKHRDPPPVPRTSRPKQIPPRPPKMNVPPPSYEEAAGREKARGEFPQEKQSLPRPSRTHRSHSDSSRPHTEHSRSRNSQKDKERKSHKSKSKSPRKKPEPVKSKNMDTIDKLDVTGFFGGGFHHDGPFDACTPHRNKNVKAAPVMAFPADGPNNSIKGSATVNKNAQVDLAFGNYSDQNEIIGRKPSIKTPQGGESNPNNTNKIYVSDKSPSVINFSANSKAEPIHGSTTAGLGSSTFIDGAPAPKLNDDFLNTSNGGLSRKKSIVSRLRKNSNSENNTRRPSADADNVLSHKALFADSDANLGQGSSLLRRVKSLKVRR